MPRKLISKTLHVCLDSGIERSGRLIWNREYSGGNWTCEWFGSGIEVNSVNFDQMECKVYYPKVDHLDLIKILYGVEEQ